MASDPDPAQLSVTRFIAHRVPRVPRGKQGAKEPRFSTQVPDVPVETLDFFAQRLKRNLAQAGHAVEVNPALDDPPVPDAVREALLDGSYDLVEVSKKLARQLWQTQGASKWEEESLFVTLDVTIGGQPGLVVMKLEQEEGVELEEKEDDDGLVIIVTVNDRLMLTDNTRVFKAALFWLDQETLGGLVSDEQQGDPTDVAGYFLAFLGCRHRRSPALKTKAFVQTVEKFVSTDVGDPEEKLEYDTALKVYIASNKKRIEPVVFVEEHIRQGPMQAKLLSRLQEAEVPTQGFVKDTARLGTRATSTRLTTQGGIKITGPSEAISDRVRTGADDDGVKTLIIRDTLTSVR